MSSTELAFEQFNLALEATRGTAISAPTHLIHCGGLLKPANTTRWAKEMRGTTAINYRHVKTKEWAEWETVAEEADVNLLPVWLNMAVQGAVTSPTTPASGALTRDWTFTRNISADNRKSATLWFGDPNIQTFQGAYAMLDELTLSADASADDGVLTWAVKGMCQPITKVSNPSVPAAIAGVLMPAQLTNLYIDTSSAIGTTAISGRYLSSSHTITTGITYKTIGAGPTSTLGYSSTGVKAVVGIQTKVKFEVPDMTQYDLWKAATDLKVRLQYNGAAIETVTGPITYYNMVQVDCYGPFEVIDLGENADSNRVYEFTINGAVDSTLGSDTKVVVRSQRTSL